jgi:hypothetical protein
MVQFDTELVGFLDHDVKIYRSSSFTVNDYGEVILDALTLEGTTKMRIEPARSEVLTTMLQGKEVLITHKGFALSTEDIQIGDMVEVIATGVKYAAVLVNPYYDKDTLDHYEIFLKRVDNL